MSNKYPGGIITSGANAGYSVYCDGTGDYLQATTASLSGAFTVEFWYYRVGTGSNYCFTIGDSFTSTGIEVYIGTSGTVFNAVYIAGVAQLTSTTQLPTANAWTHIALVRDGSNVIRCYLNGTQVTGSYTSSATFNNTVRIGAEYYNGSVTGSANAYFSNFRIVNGTALYTAAFTPPTQLFAITNTSLLTCNSPAIVDQSSNAFTITANGNAAVSTFTPFTGYTAYNPALGAATPGIWTVSDAIQAAQTRRWNMYDPYFNLTTLLLHGNGTNGAQNNTFLDSSSNNFTITRNGNTTQGTFSPFSQTGWSGFFTGAQTSPSLSFPSNAAYSIGSTSDFTVEAWVYFTGGIGSEVSLVERFDGTSGPGWILGKSSGDKFWFGFGGTTYPGNTSVVANRWYHICWMRTGGNSYLFLDGVLDRAAVTTSNFTDGTTPLSIGERDSGSQTFPFTGYMSNLRIVKGTAVYSTSGFTVPTAPLTAITNTTLLTLQSNRFVDNSTTAATATVGSASSIQPFSPFYPVVAYTPQAQGGSGYFDGNGDVLNAGSNAAWAFGTGNFTVECWCYLTSFTNNRMIIVQGTTTFGLWVNSSGQPLIDNVNVGALLTSSISMPLNAWTHIAAVRSGTTLAIYVNGASGGTVTNSTNFGQNTLYIGGDGVGYYTAGYLSGVRILKGTAQYTAAFTPPTSPPTNITNTSLLLNFTNAGITDATAKNVLETVGNAQISTTQSKFGGSSMSFDGTGYLKPSGNQQLYRFGTGDFTVEMWVYLTSYGTNTRLYDGRPAANGPYLAIQVNTGGFSGTSNALQVYVSSAVRIDAGVAVTLNSWFHLAVCRSGTSTKMFVNGTQSGSTYTDSTDYSGGNAVPTIGASEDGNNKMSGYIDDLRISRYARYTANFTPQTSQWQDQ